MPSRDLPRHLKNKSGTTLTRLGGSGAASPEPAMRRLDPVQEAIAELRAKAAEFRQAFADEARARTLDWAADRIEEALRRSSQEVLTLADASQRSGYSQGHLARLVRDGRIPDMRPPGSRGRIRIRLSDLPARPGATHTQCADVHELASRLYGGREGRHGHP